MSIRGAIRKTKIEVSDPFSCKAQLPRTHHLQENESETSMFVFTSTGRALTVNRLPHLQFHH